jgi:hypothetical protein
MRVAGASKRELKKTRPGDRQEGGMSVEALVLIIIITVGPLVAYGAGYNHGIRDEAATRDAFGRHRRRVG